MTFVANVIKDNSVIHNLPTIVYLSHFVNLSALKVPEFVDESAVSRVMSGSWFIIPSTTLPRGKTDGRCQLHPLDDCG